MWLILALILIGMVAGGIAERVVYPEWKIDWTEAFVVGLAGSLLGGLLGSLGSLLGALGWSLGHFGKRKRKVGVERSSCTIEKIKEIFWFYETT